MTRRRAPAPPQPLDIDRVDAVAFGLADALTPGAGDWHAHRFDQVLYVAEGLVRLELDEGTWLLPSARAAFIAASTRHRVDVAKPAALRTTYLDPALGAGLGVACGVFGVAPLAREMLLQAAAWGPDEVRSDALAPVCEPFFRALAALVAHWGKALLPWHLPRAASPELRRATRLLLDHLDAGEDASLEAEVVARRAGLSTRTLSRRFVAETGLTLRGWMHHARMLRAIEGLSDPAASVTDVALAAGYQSLPTFSRLFQAFTGESPRAFRALRSLDAGAGAASPARGRSG